MVLQSMQCPARSALLNDRTFSSNPCPFTSSRRQGSHHKGRQVGDLCVLQDECWLGATYTSSLIPHTSVQVVVAAATQQSKQGIMGVASRREALHLALIGLITQHSLPALAAERRGMNRYIKKKSLDPLETCVLLPCFTCRVTGRAARVLFCGTPDTHPEIFSCRYVPAVIQVRDVSSMLQYFKQNEVQCELMMASDL